VKSTVSEGTVSAPAVEDESTERAEVAGVETPSSERAASLDLDVHAEPSTPPWERSGSELAGNGGGGGAVTLEGEKKGPELEESGGGAYSHDDTTFRAKIARDGTVELEDKLIPTPRLEIDENGRPRISIPLDVTDTVMRLAGQDPYAYEKRKLLAETQELRAEMAEAACKENLASALLDIKPRLHAIWDDRALSLAQKKRKIFGLWDECAEEGSADVLRTSEMIRASIVAFIAEHLPPASVLAYSSQDLAELNRERRSSAEFLPYRGRDAGL
jgi:hypothetical protein